MPKATLSLKLDTNNILPISPEQLEATYFFGIPIVDQSGNPMSKDRMAFFIKAAKESIEGFLNLKLDKQMFTETLSHHFNDYKSWGFVPTSFPVIKAHKLVGLIDGIEQVIYPPEWLSSKKATDGTMFDRAVYLIPITGSHVTQSSVVYSGVTPHAGILASGTIPNYWELTYCTSFNRIPEDILDAIGKLAAINIYHQLGDIILGAGIASQSLGMDGLSQSVSTTSSATNAGYGARVSGYLADLKLAKPLLKAKYDGMVLGIL